MRKISFLCAASIVISLFGGFSVHAEAEQTAAETGLLEALEICTSAVADAEYVTRGQFAEYIHNIYCGGSSNRPETDSVSFALENGYINNASSGDFEPDMAIRNDVAAKALVDLLGFSFKVKTADDYWIEAGALKLVSGMSRYDLLTGENCVKMLNNALDSEAYVFSGVSGEDAKLEKVEAIDAFYDLRIVKGKVTAVEDKTLTNGKSAGIDCAEIDGRIYEFKYDMSDFLGMNVKAYITKKDDIIFYAEDNSYKTVTFTDDKINRTSSTLKELVADGEKRTERYRFETDVDVVINGDGYFAYTLDDLLPDYGSVTLIDNDGNSLYDVVRIKSYQTIAVNYTENTNQTIGDFYGNDISNLKDMDSLTITRDGKKAYFSEILQDDVAGVAVDKSGKHAEIAVTSQKLYGVISSVSADKVTVDGAEYTLAPYLENLSDDKKPKISVGDNLVATLDMYGRIAYIKQSGNSLLKYGYMINAYVSDLGENMIKLFTSDGIVETYKVSDKAKIDGAVQFTNETILRVFSSNGVKVAPQLIKYGFNGDNEINRLYSKNSDKLSCDFEPAKRSESGGSRVFSDSGDFVYNTSTVIFSVPDPEIESDDEDYAIVKRALNSTSAYDYTKISAYDVDEFGIAKAVVSQTTADLDAKITSDIKRDTEILVVSKIVTCVTDDGEVMKKICGYDKNDEQEFYIREDKYSLIDGTGSQPVVEPGDAIICLRDFITDYVTDLLVVNKASSTEYFLAKDKITSGQIPYYEVLRGKVHNRLGSTIKVSKETSPSAESDYKIYPSTGAVVFIVEDGKVRYGNIGEIQIDDEILIRARASVVWEIIIYR